MSLTVLVADDSILYRRALAEALASLPDVQVVGAVGNGKLALQRIRDLRPDLVTLDMEMPEMDGLAVLDALRQSNGAAPAVIVVSGLTKAGGQLTLKALEKGAFDFITKPDTSNAQLSLEALRRELAPRVRALAHRLEVRQILRSKVPPQTATAGAIRAGVPARPPRTNLEEIAGRMSRLASPTKADLVVIGVSTGGPNALALLLPQIPGNLGVPLLVVQHMPPIFTQSLAESLAAKCALRVREASAGERVQPNTVYIAPGGAQMRVAAPAEGGMVVQITDDPPENNCRPAVDYLFRSVANHFTGQVLAVILTGMGSDGTTGVRLLKRKGCMVIAQDEASCVVFGMPKAAIEAGVVDEVVSLDLIATRITALVRGGKP